MSLQQVFLCLGMLLLIVSLRLHFLNKERLSIIILLASSFFFFFFSANVYPFINVWDERFHALVAKNLLNHPLKPTLYDETLVNIAYDRWDRYHIWLHKQPLFMWQISLSFKIFGINETSLRLPSVLLSVLFVFAAYRSGKILGNKNIGFYTAILITTSSYLLKLISGGIELDQNDVSFICYISLSIWAWLEYINSKNWVWLIITGFFSGFAILCKWLVGFLIYLIWGMFSLMSNKYYIKKYWDIAFSLLITLITFLPWQFLILAWYPTEAKYSLALNSKHFYEAVDGHEGSFFYHFTKMPDIFGQLVPFLIIPSFFIFYKTCADRKIALSFIFSILFVYIFFSLAVTKMPSFTTVLLLPIYLSLAFFIDYLIVKIQSISKNEINNIALTIIFLTICFYKLDFLTLFSFNSFSNNDSDLGYRKALSHNKRIFTNLNLPSNSVLFNVKGRHYVEAMFYSGLPSYNIIPSEQDYNDLKAKGRKIVIFKNETLDLPDYLKKDDVSILQDTIYLCE